jgi:Domain of unknown function (DUF4189)
LQQWITAMRRLTLALGSLALGSAVLLAGSAFAQTSKTVSPKTITDYKAVQEHLFELNYNVGERNGQASPQLTAAIAEWRKNRNSAATGDMTEAEAAQLLAVPRPKTWAAIAYSASGPHGIVFNKPTRDAATKEALLACDKDNKKCGVVAGAGTSCAAVATFSGNVDGKPSLGGWGSHRPTLAAAKDAALAACKKNAPVPDSCTVRDAVCADGSHKK